MAAALIGAAPPAPAPSIVEGDVLSFDGTSDPGSVGAPLVSGARFTAMDLLKRVFTDLDKTGHYRTISPVKPVDNAVAPEMGAGYAQESSEPALEMQPPTYAVVRQGNHAIGFVLGGGVLVSDWLLPVPASGGAMYVQTDPGSTPTIERAFAVAEGEAVALVLNSHNNAGENFEFHSLFSQSFSGLRQVHSGIFLYSFTETGSGRCASRFHRQKLDRFQPLPARAGGHANIAVTVSEAIECNGDFKHPVSVRKFPFTLIWNARTRRYVGGSPALDQLNRSRI